MTGASLAPAASIAGSFAHQMARATGRLREADAPAPAPPDVNAALRDAGTAMLDAVTAASAESVEAAAETLNDALDEMASQDVSLDFQVSIANAVREAVAGVPDAAASGLTVSAVDGKERLVIDTAALAEALARDPQALRALVSGEKRIQESVRVAVAEAEEVAAAEEAPPEPVAEVAEVEREPEVATMLRSADMSMRLRTLELLHALTAAPLQRLDILV